MIKSFSYTNAKGHTTVRICNVVYEIVNKVYPNDHKPTPCPTEFHKTSEVDYDSLGIPKELFSKAYRVFKKSKCF